MFFAEGLFAVSNIVEYLMSLHIVFRECTFEELFRDARSSWKGSKLCVPRFYAHVDLGIEEPFYRYCMIVLSYVYGILSDPAYRIPSDEKNFYRYTRICCKRRKRLEVIKWMTYCLEPLYCYFWRTLFPKGPHFGSSFKECIALSVSVHFSEDTKPWNETARLITKISKDFRPISDGQRFERAKDFLDF